VTENLNDKKMEMTSVSQEIVDHLKLNAIPHQSIHHAAAASVLEYQQTLGTRLEQQAKALFIRYKKSNTKGFAIVAIQAQKRLDLDMVCKLLHAKEARLGTHEQLMEATGCNYGELPPLGKIFSLTLLMDKELLKEDQIYFNAGSLTFSIILSPVMLAAFEEPILF
jgi:Ala-tRNA(Pro) deacylase